MSDQPIKPAEPEGNRDANTRETLQAIGRVIDEALPQGWGFFLMSFPFNDAEGRMNYIANSQREDVIKLMHEFIQKEDRLKGYGEHVADNHVWLDLPREDVEFLIWALGRAAGGMATPHPLPPVDQSKVCDRCREIWPKLAERL